MHCSCENYSADEKITTEPLMQPVCLFSFFIQRLFFFSFNFQDILKSTRFKQKLSIMSTSACLKTSIMQTSITSWAAAAKLAQSTIQCRAFKSETTKGCSYTPLLFDSSVTVMHQATLWVTLINRQPKTHITELIMNLKKL